MKCRYEHDGDCCNAGADQYMCKCKKPCEFIWPLSNADHIRSMTDEELAEFLDSVYCHGWTKGANDILDDEPYYHDWLKQPYKEDA